MRRKIRIVVLFLCAAASLWMTSRWLRSYDDCYAVYLRLRVASFLSVNWWDGKFSCTYGAWEFDSSSAEAEWRRVTPGANLMAPPHWQVVVVERRDWPPRIANRFAGFGWDEHREAGMVQGANYKEFSGMAPGWLPPLTMMIAPLWVGGVALRRKFARKKRNWALKDEA